LGFYKIPFWKMAILMFIGKALRFLFWIGLWFLMPEKLLKP
jgi:membrane protein YqaA with SNARE-associated domain